jgi:proton-dependent oligopeptide transporter, POT family
MNQISNKMPKGIPYIIGNEAAERYSFYGMKAILVIFLTNFIMNANGELDVLDSTDAKFWLHIFVFATYGISIVGAFISDILWGKFKTIMVLSVVYCIGHFVLALYETHYGFLFGCTLIAIGAGGIKPCVSAHVGDQFDSTNKHLIEKMYNWFYFSINAGAVIAYITAEPLLRNEYLISKGLNTSVAFGLPGILMVIATIVFWMGRKKFTSVKPAGWALYREELFSKKGLEMVLRLAPVFLFLSVFWSLFDQTGSAWVIQADSDLMNKTINLGFVSFDFYPSQIGFFNPLLVVILIPVFTVILYPYLRSKFNLNYISKMTIGMVLAAVSFALISWVQGKMDNGFEMTIAWQILGFFILTSAEIFVSISSLEFSYTQAPNSLKSLILSFWLLSTAIGNGFTALINFFIKRPDGTLLLEGAAYFWFFTILMAVSAVLFYWVNRNYKETFYTQDLQ